MFNLPYTPILNYDRINLVLGKQGGIHMKRIGTKNPWVLVLLMLAGIVLGGFLGTLTENIAGLSWLNYGESFGLGSPIVLNLGIIIITFGLSIKITIASIIGLILAAIIYRFI